MLLFFALNLPVAFSVLLAVFLYFFQVSDGSPLIAVQRLVGAAENTTILAVPFFIMLGTVMNYTGITRRMLRLAEVLSGHLPGGACPCECFAQYDDGGHVRIQSG